jgi:hypothetical protein
VDKELVDALKRMFDFLGRGEKGVGRDDPMCFFKEITDVTVVEGLDDLVDFTLFFCVVMEDLIVIAGCSDSGCFVTVDFAVSDGIEIVHELFFFVLGRSRCLGRGRVVFDSSGSLKNLLTGHDYIV